MQAIAGALGGTEENPTNQKRLVVRKIGKGTVPSDVTSHSLLSIVGRVLSIAEGCLELENVIGAVYF